MLRARGAVYWFGDDETWCVSDDGGESWHPVNAKPETAEHVEQLREEITPKNGTRRMSYARRCVLVNTIEEFGT